MNPEKIITGKVADLVDEYTIILNIGVNAGVKKDMRFAIKGEKAINDPDNGKRIGNYKYDKVIVVIDEVQDNMSVASTPQLSSIGFGFDIINFPGKRKKVTDEQFSSFSLDKNVAVGDLAVQT